MPTDLSHIRVSIPFTSKLRQKCGCGCGQETIGKTVGLVENTRSGKKRAYLETCLAERPALLERREDSSEASFLA